MCKTRGSVKWLLVASVATLFCGHVFAAEQSKQKDQGRTTQQIQEQTQAVQQQRQQVLQPGGEVPMSGKLHQTSKLIGKQIKNAQNEDLGSVYDLVLTSDHQQVSYVALSSGGTWGIGAKYYAVPWSALQIGPQGNITTSISKNQLGQTAFDKNNWPVQPTAQLMSSTSPGAMPGQSSQMDTQRQFTDTSRDRTRSGQTTDRVGAQQGTMDNDRDRQTASRTGAGMGTGAMVTNRDIQYRRVSNITGTSVRNIEGEDIGDIEDFVVDATQGQVAYTIVSFGGFWGIGEKFAAVPGTAIQIQPRRNVARLDADRATLEKIAFNPDSFPDLSNRQYAQQLHQMFNVEPYWTVLGYVGSEQDQAASQRAWGADGGFAKQFDAKNVKTIQGTVQSIGNFQPEGAAPGSSGGLRIRLTTDDGNLATVYAGPQWYAQQHDFYVKPGDKISVTGSQTKVGWRPVLVASQIKAGDKTLLLRNENGQPVWQCQQDQSGQQSGQDATQPRSGQSSQQPGSTGGAGSAGQRQQGQGQPDNQ